MEENNSNGLVVILVLALVWAIFFHKDSYEGQTAEEWFNTYDEAESAYQEFRTCVEDFDSFDLREKIEYESIFNYCE